MSFTSKKLSRIDPVLDFNWGLDAPAPEVQADTFSVRWTGRLRPQFSEDYTFFVTADDGIRLWVGGELLVDQWRDQAPTTYSATKALVGGRDYALRMDFYENGFGAVARLEWESPSQSIEVIPPERMLPPNQPPVVSVKAPVANSSVAQTSVINIEVDAIDTDGEVKVQFLVDNAMLGELLAPPFNWPWSNPSLGLHTIGVRAIDDTGATTSVNIPVTVVAVVNLSARLSGGGELIIEFAAQDGLRFRLRSSSDLETWGEGATTKSVNGRGEFRVNIDGDQRFFRVAQEP